MFKLRPYQKEAVARTLDYFRKKRDPALIVLPTGAGKSLVIAELAKVARGRVLALAHVKELVEQNHAKYVSYGLEAGIFSAGLGKKDTGAKTIFGSIQSVANAPDEFFTDFSLVVIDECHRVSDDGNTQYQAVIGRLRKENSDICVLGLTATPYRAGLGWIYQTGPDGEIKTAKERFFRHCLYELPLSYMVKKKYLTPPVKVNIPVTCYDFSDLQDKRGPFSSSDIERILKSQRSLTPLIVKNIVDIAERYERKGVMIFTASVKHAKEVLSFLPEGQAKAVFGSTDRSERDEIIAQFKDRKFKYLVNVSVLTTGFDAPFIDVIAIMRPTESASLYQQIVGRGLRLSPGKKECVVLDYTGMEHNIYAPNIRENRPTKDAVPVEVTCPQCGFANTFWGKLDYDGDVMEHFGRKCKGASIDERTYAVTPCGYRFRAKLCHQCGCENDVGAKSCVECETLLVDAQDKLKQARLSKDAHILRPDTVTMEEKVDKKFKTYLEVRYYDVDAQHVEERHYLNGDSSLSRFNIDFLRTHLKRPELAPAIRGPKDVIDNMAHLRSPAYVIARKQGKFWRITEKIFHEEL